MVFADLSLLWEGVINKVKNIEELLQADYENTIVSVRQAFLNKECNDSSLLLSIAKEAFSRVFFDDAREFVGYALSLNHCDAEILNFAACVELQFSLPKARELAVNYFKLKAPLNESKKKDKIIASRCAADQQCLVSILLPSTLVNNNWNRVHHLINSLNEKSVCPEKVEIVVKIDERDDAKYYVEALSKLREEFSYTLIQGSSYEGLRSIHRLYHDCMLQKSPHAAIAIPVTDRMMFTQDSWDKIILEYMIGTTVMLTHLKDSGHLATTSRTEWPWLIFLTQPSPLTYAVNVKFLEYVYSEFKKIEKNATYFGADYNVGIYLSILAYFSQTYSKNLSVDLFGDSILQAVLPENAFLSDADRKLWSMIEYHSFLKRKMNDKLEKIISKAYKTNRKFFKIGKDRSLIYSFKLWCKKQKRKLPVYKKILKYKMPLRRIHLSWWEESSIKERKTCNALSLSSPCELLSSNGNDSGAKISIFMGSRLKGNSNFKLDIFLNSVKNTITEPEVLEILIAVDMDDDIDQLKIIAESFPTLCIKLIGTQRGAGYFDLHTKYHLMMPNMGPVSELMMICSDDCFFYKKGWEQQVIRALETYPDKICFINLFLDRDLGTDSVDLANWWIFQRGPSSIYPVVSRRVLEIIRQKAVAYNHYTAFGPSLMVDSFFEMVHMHIMAEAGIDRMIKLPGIIRRLVERDNNPEISKKLKARYHDALLMYHHKLSEEHQRFLKATANEIIEKVGETSPFCSQGNKRV
ncbi:MAG: hypothetical protein K2W94_02675 [Alphaproteobacteria bacterium]|nr:hypothetical protein [Alphaproteobacteria bacterium]